MVKTPPAQPAGREGGEVDRLSRVADMLCNAVALLNEAMDEIKAEKGNGEDDGYAPGAPQREPQ